MPDPSWTSVEWTALGAVLSGAGTVIGALAVIGAAWFGSRTFESWRKQTLSQRRIEQAERILTATYRVRRGLSYVRNPMLWAHELETAEEYLKEKDLLPDTEPEKKRLTTTQAYYNRINAEQDNKLAVEECQPMARALFGEDVEKALETLNHQLHIVVVAAEAMSWTNNDAEFAKMLRADLSSAQGSAMPNKMNDLIAEQVRIIESVCVPVLRLEK